MNEMNEVVLIRCLDEWMDFYCPLALILIPSGVMRNSFFQCLFLVAILGGFWVPAGTPKSTKNHFLEQFFDDFCGACLFSLFFRRFSFDFTRNGIFHNGDVFVKPYYMGFHFGNS